MRQTMARGTRDGGDRIRMRWAALKPFAQDEGQDTDDASSGCASTARIACQVNGAVRPSATGTRQNDTGAAQCRARA